MHLGALDDFELPVAGIGDDPGGYRPLIACIGEDLLDRREAAPSVAQEPSDAVAILNVGSVNDDVQQQAKRIDEDVALAARDFLARVVSLRIDRGPPFCAALALWLSRIAAVGVTLRPAASRTWAYKA